MHSIIWHSYSCAAHAGRSGWRGARGGGGAEEDDGGRVKFEVKVAGLGLEVSFPALVCARIIVTKGVRTDDTTHRWLRRGWPSLGREHLREITSPSRPPPLLPLRTQDGVPLLIAGGGGGAGCLGPGRDASVGTAGVAGDGTEVAHGNSGGRKGRGGAADGNVRSGRGGGGFHEDGGVPPGDEFCGGPGLRSGERWWVLGCARWRQRRL